jgi:phosphoribosylamine--glycine ligase
MKYLVLGSGGREHAIAWRLLHDGSATDVYVTPGNGGIDDKFRAGIPVNDFRAVEEFCVSRKIDAVVVGPEAPLVDGIVDFLTDKKIPAFGPSARAAMLEGSKLFAKSIMEKYGIPTAGHYDFTEKPLLIQHIANAKEFPLVIKLDGLAAGKGVCVAASREEALTFISEMVPEHGRFFVEDYIDGEEASILGISDGSTILSFVAAQDHKRVYDGDLGPNTGGMGAYAPAPVMTEGNLKKCTTRYSNRRSTV